MAAPAHRDTIPTAVPPRSALSYRETCKVVPGAAVVVQLRARGVRAHLSDFDLKGIEAHELARARKLYRRLGELAEYLALPELVSQNVGAASDAGADVSGPTDASRLTSHIGSCTVYP